MARKQLPPRIEAGDNGTYYVKYSEEGRSQRQSLKTTDMATAQARFSGWLDARGKAEVEQRSNTFSFAFKKYMEQHVERRTASPETIAFVGVQLNWFFGAMILEDITLVHVLEYTKQRMSGVRTKDGYKRPVKGGTVRKELGIMRAVLRFMCERVEPFELRAKRERLCYIELPPQSPARTRVLSYSELDRIKEICKGPMPPSRIDRLSRFLWLLMETGARAGAIRSLTWGQVDFKHGRIHYNPPGREQNNKRRPIVPISDELRPVLLRAHVERTSEFVLDHDGEIRKSVDRFMKDHCFPSVTAHVFRHSFATHLAEESVEMRDIAQMLGDSVETVEKNYLHLSSEYLKKALDALKTRGGKKSVSDAAVFSLAN